MKVFVSDFYLKWRKSNKNVRAAGAIDKFLSRVFAADDPTEVSPKPKAAGNNLRKTTGVVNEFTLNYHYRAYGKYTLYKDELCFRLATFGDKGNTNQHDDILTALDIFDNTDAVKWESWEPSAEQIEADLATDETPEVCNNISIPEEPAQPAKTKKGKPLDENGLTVAERKALRKKQQQEDQQQRKKEKQRVKQLKKCDEATDITTESIVSDIVSETSVATDETVAGTEQVTPAIGNMEFKYLEDVQYTLELMEHQIKIEKLKIARIQHEIALEELAINKLQ